MDVMMRAGIRQDTGQGCIEYCSHATKSATRALFFNLASPGPRPPSAQSSMNTGVVDYLTKQITVDKNVVRFAAP